MMSGGPGVARRAGTNASWSAMSRRWSANAARGAPSWRSLPSGRSRRDRCRFLPNTMCARRNSGSTTCRCCNRTHRRCLPNEPVRGDRVPVRIPLSNRSPKPPARTVREIPFHNFRHRPSRHRSHRPSPTLHQPLPKKQKTTGVRESCNGRNRNRMASTEMS